MDRFKIVSVRGREILDSRGMPTVEAEVTLNCGVKGTGRAPSGASTGKYEAAELRDGDGTRYMGKGVLRAVENVNTKIAEAIIGTDASNTYEVDRKMILLDGTENKSNLGANAILAVSIAAANAAAAAKNMELYQFLGKGQIMPLPMMNILNGGAHASNDLDIQEFMIVPIGAENYKEGLRWCAEVYAMLKKLLTAKGYGSAVGDEGGFAPELEDEKMALRYILWAVEMAGYKPGRDFEIALDAAASEWKGAEPGKYVLPKSRRTYTSEQLIGYWKDLTEEYPIMSIEDPLDEEDWAGWKQITEELGDRLQLVGDDLFVTNQLRLQRGIKGGCGNCILIKPNQIGTISETIETVRLAQKAGYKTIASHRSGETEDTTIADLAIALNMGQIKTGAPCRSERTAKYNRLLRIEEWENIGIRGEKC